MIRAAEDFVGWLDARQPCFVVYASRGSLVVLSGDEVAEMAHRLEFAGRRPFLWVLLSDYNKTLATHAH